MSVEYRGTGAVWNGARETGGEQIKRKVMLTKGGKKDEEEKNSGTVIIIGT
jgi:hypothetical protein